MGKCVLLAKEHRYSKQQSFPSIHLSAYQEQYYSFQRGKSHGPNATSDGVLLSAEKARP